MIPKLYICKILAVTDYYGNSVAATIVLNVMHQNMVSDLHNLITHVTQSQKTTGKILWKCVKMTHF